MKCDLDSIIGILCQVESCETNDPIVYTNRAVYNGKTGNQNLQVKEFPKIYTNTLFIGDCGLADVRDPGNKAGVAIERITPKGSKFLVKALILKAITEGKSSEKDIAKFLELQPHTVNVHLKQLIDRDFLHGARVLKAEGHEYKSCALKSKGKAALKDPSLLVEESSMSNNEYNFHAPVGSVGNQGTQTNVAGVVEGNQIETQNNYASQETLSKVSTEIERLLDYFEHNDPSITQAQQIIKNATEEQPEILDAEIVEEAIKSSPTLRQRLGSAGVAAYIETVKMLLPPFGIAYEAYKAFKNPE